MKAYVAVARTLWASRLREPVGLFFSFAFAPALVLILGLVFGNSPRPEFGGRGQMEATLPAFASLVLAMTGVLQVPLGVLTLRETGAFRRLRLSPLRPWTFVAADVSVNLVVGMAGMLAALLVGILVFGVSLPHSVIGVLLVAVAGLMAFLAVGYALAGLYPSVGAATGVGNVLMILLMLTSGAFAPISAMPQSVQRIVELSPVRHFVVLMQGIWDGKPLSGLTTSLWVLLGLGAACTAIGTTLFRWDRA